MATEISFRWRDITARHYRLSPAQPIENRSAVLALGDERRFAPGFKLFGTNLYHRFKRRFHSDPLPIVHCDRMAIGCHFLRLSSSRISLASKLSPIKFGVGNALLQR